MAGCKDFNIGILVIRDLEFVVRKWAGYSIGFGGVEVVWS
jgi:hypothetical protein